MKYVFIYFFVFFLFFSALCSAQNFSPADVTLAQLEEKFYPADSTAEAAIVYATGKSEIKLRGLTWRLVTTTNIRIKIYKSSGFRHADKEMRYIEYENYGCTVTGAATYNIENGKVEKTVLQDADIYNDKLNEYIGVKKIHMPNVRQGSIIEYTYEVVSPSIGYIPKWYFQYEIPVEYSEYEVSIPTYFTFNRLKTGNIAMVETAPKIVQQEILEVDVINYTAKNIPAIKTEPLAGNVINYIAAVWFEIAAVDYHVGESVEKFNTDWESMTKKMYESENFGKQLKPTSYFNKDFKKVVQDTMTPVKKVAAIFNFVQSRMAWNGRESFYCSKGLKWAYENKTGNVAEINLLLLAMLQHADIEAYPVIVSTRDNGVAMHANFSSYNYVIVLAKIAGKEILLDATNKNVKPGLLPVNALNHKGRLVRSDGNSKEVDLTVAQQSKNVATVVAAINEAGVVSGKVRQSYHDYYGVNFRESYIAQDSLYVGYFEKKTPGIIINNHKIRNLETNSQPVVEEYDFTHNSLTDASSGKIYFSPLLFFNDTSNPFTAPERLYPIDYIFPFEQRRHISVTIPPGYVVESLPQNLTLDLPDQTAQYSYTISASGNVLQFIMALDVPYSFIDTAYYPDLKDFYQKIVKKQSEKIVLKKSQ